MELDWEKSLDDWAGGDDWGNLAWENCSGPKRNLGDFSNRDCTFASKDYAAAMSRPHSCVRRHSVSLKKRTLFKDMVRCLTV